MSAITKAKVEIPDDTTLTRTEKRFIVETWNLYIKKDITYHGCIIFTRYLPQVEKEINGVFRSLFMKFPDYLQYFTSLAQLYIENSELMENKDFQAHCLIVMTSLNTMIEYGLSDPPLLKALIAKFGRSHFGRNMTFEPIKNVCDIMLQYIIENCKKAVKPEVREAWRKFFDYIFEGILVELSV